jgi:tripartite-type tricarboxylate transporter receptor subunit TctC
MPDRRRTFLATAASALAAVLATARGAGAQPGGGAAGAATAWPNRPVRLVIPWPPGQASDLIGRVVAQKLADSLGQPIVPENRPGAGGMIGSDAVARAAPDGYTLLAGSSGPLTTNPLVQRTPYDPDRDFTPVALVGVSPYQLVVRPDFPAADARAFVAALRAAPGRYTFSSSGTGATAHLIGEMFNRTAGIEAVHVPFTGSAASMTAVASGQVDYSIETLAATNPIVRAGRLRALGVSVARGSALAPGVPPIAEAADMPGFDAGAWWGIMLPARSPAPVTARLAEAIRQAAAEPEVRERFSSIGFETDVRTGEAFTAYLAEQREKFAAIVRAANIRIE